MQIEQYLTFRLVADMLYPIWATAIWHQECERKYLNDAAKFYSLFGKKESI